MTITVNFSADEINKILESEARKQIFITGKATAQVDSHYRGIPPVSVEFTITEAEPEPEATEPAPDGTPVPA